MKNRSALDLLIKQVFRKMKTMKFDGKTSEFKKGYEEAEMDIILLLREFQLYYENGCIFAEFEGLPNKNTFCYVKCKYDNVGGIAFYSAETKCFYWLPSRNSGYEKIQYKVTHYQLLDEEKEKTMAIKRPTTEELKEEINYE